MRLIVAHNLSQLPVFFFSAGLANSPGLCPNTMRLSSLIKISAWAFPQLQHVSPSILLPQVTLNPTIHGSYGKLRRAMSGSQHRGCAWPQRERVIASKASALRLIQERQPKPYSRTHNSGSPGLHGVTQEFSSAA